MERRRLFLGFRYLAIFTFFWISSMKIVAQNTLTSTNNNWIPIQKNYTANYSDSASLIILQLYDVPDQAQKQRLKQNGITLIEPIDHPMYLARITANVLWEEPIVKAYRLFLPHEKISDQLTAYLTTKEMVSVNVWPVFNSDMPALLTFVKSQARQIDRIYPDYLQLQMTGSDLLNLAQAPQVYHIEKQADTPRPEGIKGRALHRMNQLKNGAGQLFDGFGIGIGIADDGRAKHIDFQGRVQQNAESEGGSHGDMTAGLAVGAGNLDPRARGMAPGAHLMLHDIEGYPHIQNAVEYMQTDSIYITSTSYYEVCGGFYTGNTRQVDALVYDTETLSMIYSMGNSASQGCSPVYGDVVDANGRRFGNITGGQKAGKNTIAVANLLWDGRLHAASSLGPALDGRIKPDLAAQGHGQYTTDKNNTYQYSSGTSAAAPTVAGIDAVLYQAYKYYHGEVPDAAFTKACMLNTAEDLGRPGPDYEYGWGQVHAQRALSIIEEETFLKDSITHQQNRWHNIYVPAGTQQLRVMVYWTDPEASVYAQKTLVNDLDMKLYTPANQVFLPWTLSTFPHIDSLTSPAHRGADHINNMEQITIDQPQAGNYQIQIQGFEVPTGPQSYYLVYYFENTDLEIMYPVADSKLQPGKSVDIHWDAFDDHLPFELAYLPEGSTTWQTINENIAPEKRAFKWTIPTNVHGRVQFRVKRGNQTSISATNVLKVPDFAVEAVHPEEARVYWTPVEGAAQYDIYMLGEKYMEKIGTTNQNSFPFETSNGAEHWIAVASRRADGVESPRSIAQFYEHNSCGYTMQIELQLDQFPGQTSWQIQSETGQLLAQGGPYNGQSPYAVVQESICLPQGCYVLKVLDTAGNGLCCGRTFKLRNHLGQLIVEGGNFSTTAQHAFCTDEVVLPLQANITQYAPVSCYGAADGWALLSVTGGSGNYNYQWSSGAQQAYAGQLEAGTYTVTISDGNQQLVRAVQITQPTPLSASISANNASCNAQNGSLACLPQGGTPPYTYIWSNGSMSPQLNGLAAGNYWVSITDANGCTLIKQQQIEQSNGLSIELQTEDASCPGTPSGSAVLTASGGTPPYHFEWNIGIEASALYGLTAGNYSVTISDANGCEKVQPVLIAEPTAIELQANIQNISCADEQDGSIAIQVSGGMPPYTYAWNTGAGSAQINNLSAAWYQLTITDQGGCTKVGYYHIEEPTALEVDAQIFLSEDNDGEIDISVHGGTPPYSYYWSNGASTASISNLQAGTYTLEVVDASDCSVMNTYTVTGGTTDYCSSSGSSTTYEWINKVTIGTMSHESGNNGGYGDFQNLVIPLNLSQSHLVKLEPGYLSNAFTEHWRIWIDFNQDGDFEDANELVFAPGGSNDVVNGLLTIPDVATLGETRMRISMKYGSTPASCNLIGYGEVEDYTVDIRDGSNDLSYIPVQQISGNAALGAEIQVYPNPAQEVLHLQAEPGQTYVLRVFRADGQLVEQQNWEAGEPLNISRLSVGAYWIQLQNASVQTHLRLVIQRN
ncbi:MAG: S8 family serine peptidase [Saprospiraceae bacterium]|nr:S8 family serine peptidase [Saprospiraceae bacterium]